MLSKLKVSPVLLGVVGFVDVNDGFGDMPGKSRKYGGHPEASHPVQDLVLEIHSEGMPF
jgi:hypothetical protein